MEKSEQPFEKILSIDVLNCFSVVIHQRKTIAIQNIQNEIKHLQD